MVQVIQEETYPQPFSMSFSWWQVLVTGLGIGVLYVVVTFLIRQFIIEPLYCGAALNVVNCSNSLSLSGNIASILVNTVGLGVMVSVRVVRPIVVALAAAVSLWGLSTWTNGLGWGEAALYSALLYAISYVLIAWICRYNETIPVVIVSILVAVMARTVVGL